MALNLEIWKILILFVTSKKKKGVKRDPKLQNTQLELKLVDKIHFGTTNFQLLIEQLLCRYGVFAIWGPF